MYVSKVVQLSIEAFGEANGVKLSPDNRWVQAATLLPWPELEEAYKTVFTRKATRGMVKSQLQYLRRNLRYIHEFQDQGGQLTSKQTQRLEVIETLYEQQDYMYRNNTHSVERRIISLSQPFVRPIKRGKAKPRNGTEFGPKVDVSIIDGVVGIERFSFDNFNENQDFEDALYHYHDVHGEFPDMALVDKLYRTRENLRIAKNLGVKVCGPKLGRQPKYPDEASERKAKKEAHEAENARGEIERNFALMKLKHGLGLVRAKTVETITTTVFTAMITANIDAVLRLFSLPFVLYVRYEGQILKIEYNDSI